LIDDEAQRSNSSAGLCGLSEESGHGGDATKLRQTRRQVRWPCNSYDCHEMILRNSTAKEAQSR